MKFFTSFTICTLLLVSALRSAATTYNVNSNGNWSAVFNGVTFASGDIINVASGVTLNCKNTVTTSANITFNIYGTLAVSQNNTRLTVGSNSVFRLYSSAGTVTVSSQSDGIYIGSTNYFAPTTTTTASSGNITIPNIQGFGGGSNLPLHFTAFDVQARTATVLLSWTAVNDGPTGSFTIERSVDGLTYTDMALVNATGGEHDAVSYRRELPAVAGTSIYRIRYNGPKGDEILYTQAQKVTFANHTSTSVSSRPGYIDINNMATGNVQHVMLSTMDGRIIGQQAINGTSLSLPVAASGMVVVTITDGGSYRDSYKVIMP